MVLPPAMETTMKLLALLAGLSAALVTPALADDHRHRDDGRAWMAERVFVYRDSSGQLQQGNWRVVEGSQSRCQSAAARADNQIQQSYGGGLLENKRYTPCHQIVTRSSPN